MSSKKAKLDETSRFDLNDITREPSDEQLAALMEAVAVEAQRRAVAARAAMMATLRAETAAALRRRTAA